MNPSIHAAQDRILAFDFGTGGLTIGLYNPSSNRMDGFGEAAYDHLSDLPDARWREQDPRDWITAIARAMQQLRKKADLSSVRITAIGIGGHMHALVVLDENDQPVLQDDRLLCGGIMWNDPRGEEQGQYLSNQLGEPIAARMTASRIRWFAEQFPGAWKERVRRVCVPSTYVGLELTGEFGVGPGDGSGMLGQLDESGQFAAEKVAAITSDVSGRLPKVGGAGETLGALNDRGAELLGLPAGIPVAFPEGDQPVGMVASGCVLPGQASISLGNSVVFNAVGTAPILDSRGVIDSFRTATGDHLLMTCVTSGCIVYDEVVRCFQPLWGGSDDELRDWLADEAARLPAGAGRIIALPFYMGEGVFRQPHAFASLLGMRDNQLSPGVLARASMEATSLVMRHGYNRMRLNGLSELVLSGGGSQNKLWPQIVADVFGVPVRKPQDAHEAATRGAAYLALFMLQQQAGVEESLDAMLARLVDLSDPVEPKQENTAVYEDMLPAMERALEQITPLYSHVWFSPQ